jgi:hypothetical protein
LFKDLGQGYNHLPLKVSDREMTMFGSSRLCEKLQYGLLLYGIKHGGPVFQCAMERVLEGLKEKHSLVYIGDVLIFVMTLN